MSERAEAPSDAAVARINARIDRLPRWGIAAGAKWVFVTAYFFAFYDIIAIGAVLPDVTRAFHLTGSQQALPLTTSLFGYIVGAMIFGRLADHYGRRPLMAATMALLAVSSVLCGLAWDLSSLSLFRFLTGMGIGAQIALSATMINEFSPARHRARNIQRNIIAAGVGDAVAPFVAMGLLSLGPDGWRLVLGLGVLSVIPMILIAWMPESPRWLAARGREAAADALVTRMETRLTAEGATLPEPEVTADLHGVSEAAHIRLIDLLRHPWLGRVVVVTLYWVLLYIAIYGFLGFETVLLDKLSVAKPQGLLYTALGDLAFPIGAALPLLLVDRMQRRYLLGISSVIFAAGLATLAFNTGATTAVIGAFLVALVLLINSGVGYIYTSEIFPTRLRATAMGFADGIGHIGGIAAPYIVLTSLTLWGARGAFGLLALLLVACGLLIAFLGVRDSAQSRLDSGIGEPS
ncbi:MFS transporter [Acidimangrovimonas sediminis]|uniref:MFS transporter n=1 Tax=Acidimangrovimonas sediminis TaxID=2056283 RepID=UPI000C80B620|nr:MFS transporter [Acidimangrovimonas sediminis]